MQQHHRQQTVHLRLVGHQFGERWRARRTRVDERQRLGVAAGTADTAAAAMLNYGPGLGAG